ncbi:MAG: hypothetical protein ACD_75C00291G0001, partial [uncultured bacterium]
MLIDWFTVIAQLVNFLILVWLMKRFLYTPILCAIDAREKRIAAELADALARKGEANRERDEFRRKNEEFERQRNDLLGTATLDARAERQRLLEEARRAHEELRIRQQEAIYNDFRNRKEEILRRTRDEVFAIARRTLSDLATESLEKQMVGAFIRRCRALPEEKRQGLHPIFAAAGPALVRSTFPLAAAEQRELELAVQQTFNFAGRLQFETSADLIGGIALSANGYEVAWSIADYLLTLEQRVAELLSVASPAEEQGE